MTSVVTVPIICLFESFECVDVSRRKIQVACGESNVIYVLTSNTIYSYIVVDCTISTKHRVHVNFIPLRKMDAMSLCIL